MLKIKTNQELMEEIFSELYFKSHLVINCRCGTPTLTSSPGKFPWRSNR